MTVAEDTDLFTTELLTVDPELAILWLENNKGNRAIRDHVVARYESDMREGRWQFNGDTIRFSEDGRLLDGQHRLWAIVQSGTAQQFLVIRGLPGKSQVTMDQGGVRIAPDQLAVVGIKADSSTAGAVRKYIQWRSGRLYVHSYKARVSTTEIVEWAQEHPAELELLRNFSRYDSIPAGCSIVRAVALQCHRIDEDEAEAFFSSLATGANLPPNSPALALLQRLRRDRDRSIRLPVRDIIGMFVTAWNAEREGRTLSTIRRPTGGWSVDTFPEPK